MKDNNAKIRLSDKAFPCMTPAMIHERDPNGEVKEWFTTIGSYLM